MERYLQTSSTHKHAEADLDARTDVMIARKYRVVAGDPPRAQKRLRTYERAQYTDGWQEFTHYPGLS